MSRTLIAELKDMEQYIQNRMLKYIAQRIFKSPPKPAMLGRWSLKHGCSTEDLVVFNANRDHCGDKICGNQEDYKNMAPRKAS
jgi:hypothetical protein